MNMQMIQHSVNDIWQMARIIADGRLFGVKSPQEAASLMLIAQAEGLHPAIAVRDYHIIQGKACLKADAMLARFQQAGGICQWECVTDAKVAAFFSHPTKSPKPVLIEWTNETVKQAQISSAMHTKYPRQMKRARVISEGVRTVLPECVCGTYAPEEIATKAAELEEIEREAAEHIKPADVTIQDTPSPFNDDPKSMDLPAVSPVNREIIVHFMGPGNPPKKKMLRDCTDAELSTVIDTARQRYKRKAASDSDKAEAESDGKLAKEWAAWRTTHPLEAPVEQNDPVAPPKAEDALKSPVMTPDANPGAGSPAPKEGAATTPEKSEAAPVSLRDGDADTVPPKREVFCGHSFSNTGKKLGAKRKIVADMTDDERAEARTAAMASLTPEASPKELYAARGVLNLLDSFEAAKTA